MSVDSLLELLEEKNIRVSIDNDELVIRAPRGALDHELAASIKQHKLPLMVALRERDTPPKENIPDLVKLSQPARDALAAQVDGGVDNVQDIYPLLPLQEGMLFHHLLDQEGDVYVASSLLSFDTRERMDRFAACLQQVIDRHDILRTAFFWAGLEQPVQVVQRKAVLSVKLIELDPQEGDIARQLSERYHPRRVRMSLQQAPLLHFHAAHDRLQQRWLACILTHHLVIDHATLEWIVEEALTIEQGHAAQLPAPVPFRNVVQQALLGTNGAGHEAYFKARLGDVDEPTAPFGLLDVQGNGSEVDEADHLLAPELSQAIRRHARRLGIAPASMMHVAWALVLASTSGRRDVVFGTVLLGRMQGGAKHARAMGLLINTLPVRIGMQTASVEACLKDTHVQLAELLRHEHAPLILAQRCSAMPAQVPLFSSLLNYRYSRPRAQSVRVAEGIDALGGEERTSYPVNMFVDDFGQDFSLTAQVDPQVGAERICMFMQTALQQLVQALDQPGSIMADIDVLPLAEREQVVHTWNATDRTYPTDVCIHELFEAQCARTPQAIALTSGTQHLRYDELNRRANQLAQHLRENGAGAGRCVALCLERSVEMVVSLLAVLKAGAAYVPLDPAYPSDRLAYMLQDTQPVAVLVDDAGVVALGDAEITRLHVRNDASHWIDASADNHTLLADSAAQLAYVIYTSGSTGMPKGVMNEHHAVVNRLWWIQQTYPLEAGDAVLQKTPYSFDVSVWEFFWPLIAGARLVMARPDGHKDPAYLCDVIQEQGITVVHFVPSMLQMFLGYAGAGDRCSGIKRIMCSGEALPTALVTQAQQLCPQARLFNLYGPTEAAVEVTAWECLCGDARTSTPIGRPIANTQIYILDDRLQPVPIGVAGELHIGGVQVARGYLNRPELTQERFIADPFRTGGRLYKTGDLARWQADGTLEYLGRNDFQVKIRGFRIELGEIEAQLAKTAGVREVVVLARDVHSEKQLVAYYTGDVEIVALREQAAQQLPAYMVPSAYVHLEHLPLTPSGKLDRKALPAPDDESYTRSQYEAPEGEREQALATIWQDLLQVERVGRHDNFFELGGHSLIAVQLVSRIRQALHVEVPLGTVFEYSTLTELAEQLPHAGSTTLTSIACADRDQPLPLSLAQQRLWFLTQMDGAGEAYHMSGAVRLEGALDRDVLQRALQRIVERHETLRTCFEREGGVPVQVVQAHASLALESRDLRGQDEEALRAHSEVHAARRFDLTRDLPVRVLLLQRADDVHVMQVVMHHIASDGWSVGIFLQELSQLYRAFLHNEADPLPPLSVQYADYAVWQRQWLEAGRLQEQSAFWQNNLAGAPTVLDLPSDRSRPMQPDHRGAHLPIHLDAALSARLKALSQRHGVTLYMTLLASWAALLSRLSRQDEVVIGSPVAGRTRTEIESLIGFFVNTLALRIDLSDQPSVGELLARTKAQVLGAQAHQDLSFDQVVEAVKPPRSTAHTPLFQVMFAWQNAGDSTLQMPGLQVTPWQSENATAQFELTLSLQEEGEVIAGSLNYATALFDAATVERYQRYWLRLLDGLANEAAPVTHLPWLDSTERERVLYTWNTDTQQYPSDRCLPTWFEAQATKHPDAIAVVYEQGRLSYAELNQRANQVAHYLRDQGIGPDRLVALAMERSADLVVAILGILKAGGAYVPLDPAYASDRLCGIVDDSQPTLVLADAVGQAALGEHTHLTVSWDAQSWSGYPTSNPVLADLAPHHLAYVIYTSGSTGKPKGVMVEHAQVARLFTATEAWFHFDEHDVWSLFHSYGFDFSVWELWGALLYGGRVVIVPSAITRSPSEFYELLCREQVTVLSQTPSAFQALLAAQATSEQEHSLRAIVFGGEALDLRTLKPWYTRNGERTQLVNMYGITETTVHVTYCPLQAQDTERAGPSPIGVRIPDLQLYVLDEQRQPVPVGVTGELYVGGAGVARGYLNRPELTQERFIADPFRTGGRLYKTGDLARWQADGTLEYLGRNDFQVKIRGFRIELGEIEAQLAKTTGAREVVVLARDVNSEKQLVAYYTGDAEISALREQASQQLPMYMVPSAYVHLERLPLTPNGKLDRKALPAPDDDAYARHAYEAPEGEREQTLATIWQELLQVERVGRHDNFFELGGHSLLVVSLIERMRKHGLHADVRTLFAAPTLAELAAQANLESRDVKAPANRIPAQASAITPDMLSMVTLQQETIDTLIAQVEGGAANVQDIYPLSPLQEGMVFHNLLHTQSDAYMEAYFVRCRSRERMERFLASLQTIIDRHDILRTGFFWDGLEQPLQVVLRQVRMPVEYVDFDPAHGDVAAQLEAAYNPRNHRLDIRRPPLIHCHVTWDEARARWLVCILAHHLAFDNTSLKLIVAEEQMIEQGRLPELPPPPPFRHFIAQVMHSHAQHEHEAFFRQMLGDIDAPTAPFGLLDVQGDGSRIAEAKQHVSPELAKAIRAHTRRLGVSPASLMHLAWALVLSRVTGRRKVVFGTVLFGRMRGGERADHGLGMFINTLPIRVDIDQSDVTTCLRQVHERIVQLLDHEHASLMLAQRCSGLSAQTPLFSSLLNYRHSEQMSRQVLDAEIEYLEGHERTNFPLTLSVDDTGDGFLLTAQTDQAIAPPRMLAFMQLALEQMVHALQADTLLQVCELDVLPAGERRQVVDTWNTTTMAYPRHQCAHELFEEQAARNPQATALSHGSQHLSYAELNHRANRLARHLQEAGVGPDQRVAICLDRSMDMVTAMLAVLKAGGAYVPVDPAYPAERLDYLLQDSAPVAVLTHARLGAALQTQLVISLSKLQRACALIDLETDAWTWQSSDDHNLPLRTLTPRHLAYVIYTSGSTGQPKGVMVEHHSLNNLVAWHASAFDVQPGSPSSSTAGVAFDASTWEIWASLCNGGHLLLAPDETAGDPQKLLQWWQRQSLHQSFLVTPLAELAYASGQLNPHARYVLIGGDRLHRWPDAMPAGQMLINNYGPTEATVVATSARLQASDAVPHIGRPIANTQIYILDDRLQPAPIGVAGEMYIGGVQVARGYLHRPELTQERFIADPFHAEGRLYKTGDLARWQPDGTLEYLGRNDFQVKVRGFRIELGEIEAQLAKAVGVREVVVLARDAAGEKQLVAYYTGSADIAVLREQAAQQLPAYMVPAAYVQLETLPLTPNGKPDRNVLPVPDDEAYARHAYEAPVGEREQALATIWQALLRVERVGRHDNFFELGGHSLLAVQLVSRIRQVLKVELPLGTIFERPVLKDLAGQLPHSEAVTLTMIERADRHGPLPLSLAQQRLWFLTQLDGAGEAYHMSGAARLDGPLNGEVLQRALQRIVERHESLRTCFVRQDGEPVQVVQAQAVLALERHDLRGQDEAAARALSEAHAACPFDLTRELPVRVLLLQQANEVHRLQVVMHHIASDGWSVGIFLQELSQLYRAFLHHEADPLPPLSLQYADYAAWQRQWLDAGQWQAQHSFWQGNLAGAPSVLDLPTDRPRPAQQDFAGASIPVSLDRGLSERLRALGQRHGVTLYMTLLASWAALLGRLSHEDEVVIGTSVAGRNRAEIEGLIGFFVNTLAMRIDLSEQPAVGELLARTRQQVLAAQAHQDLPFDQVVEAVKPPRSTAHTPLFQVMFDWHNAPASDLSMPGLALTPLETAWNTAQFELTLSLHDSADGIAGHLNYATALFDQVTVERYLRYWLRLLQTMADEQDMAIARMPILDEAERRRVLFEWNATARDYPRDACVHSLFEAQVARTPDAIAVAVGGEQLSYAELNCRANQLAHYLRKLGVQPDDRVALCIERGVATVLGLLAILKAGGAYVPLDAAYPGERIAYMLHDSRPMAVLASKATQASLRASLHDDIPVLVLDDAHLQPWVMLPAHDPDPAAIGLHAAHLAYVIYTSGSTGQPKGVMIEHRHLVNYTLDAIRWFGLQPGERVLQQNSLNFDLSLEEMMPALLSGATLIPSVAIFGSYGSGQGHPAAPTMVHLTAAHWQQLVGEWYQRGVFPAPALAGVRLINVTGDAISPHKLQQWEAIRPATTQLINTYGPTEITISCSAAYVTHEPSASRVSIGRPFANSRMYLLDQGGQPVPVGVKGELYIGGAGVARGYLNRAALTAERFVDDPFVPGERMYKTGDLACWRSDGQIEFVGRNDFQVKVRGFRVEPGEIELKLAAIDGVQDVVVMVSGADEGDKRLIAYYTGTATVQTLREQALLRLPAYMAPAAYVQLAALPLTPNGKLDRKALPAPDDAASARREYEAPQGDIEQTLATIWMHLLKQSQIGRHDNFFDLGGHSLLTVSLIERMRQADLQVDIADLFTAPTLAELAMRTTKSTEILL